MAPPSASGSCNHDLVTLVRAVRVEFRVGGAGSTLVVLSLDHSWIWDSWIADDGRDYHLYFLYAPKALADPSLRHTAARVGHATSPDLVHWTSLGDTFGPSESGWDDLAIWTGSVVQGDDGTWRLFYTAISTAGHGLFDQRVGVAESDDLHHWRRCGDSPIVVPDRRWYRTLDTDPNASETWRDPFVFRDPGGDGWHMLVTARDAWAAPNDNGVLAHARSADLHSWTMGPPVCEPGAGFGQIEVPQVRVIDGRPVLAFTCHPHEQTDARRAQSGFACTWSVPGGDVLGPWDISHAKPFEADPFLFAAPLVRRRDGQWVLLGFQNREPEGIFDFQIIDPIPVELDDDGALVQSRVRDVGS